MSKLPKRYFVKYRNKYQYFFNFVFKKIINLFFDDNERMFLNENIQNNLNKSIKIKKKKIVLIQMVPIHYWLLHYHYILKNERFKDFKIIGIWPHYVFPKPGILSPLKFLIDYLFNFFEMRKWSRLYNKIGVEVYFELNPFKLRSFFFNSNTTFFNKYYKKLNVKNISKIKYHNIELGNEIYDTFLRYYNKATITKKDMKHVYSILNLASYSFFKLEEFYKKNKNKISYYITSNISYIQSGLPAKFFISKNIKVIGGTDTNSYLNYYNKNKYGRNFENYKKIYLKLKNKKKLISAAKKFIFHSKSKFLKIRSVSLNSETKIIEKKIDILIFLPDFVDSPHAKGWLVFSDYCEWIEETLDYLLNKNLNIAIKPHPLSRYASLVYERYLEEKYKNKKIYWLSYKEDNRRLFKKDILFGISPSGSMTYDLAFNKKIVINNGRNPYMSFKYSYTPKNKKEYFDLIDKGIKNKLKIVKDNKNKVLASIYMFFLYQNDYFPVLSRKIKLFEYYDNTSNILKKIIKKKLINI